MNVSGHRRRDGRHAGARHRPRRPHRRVGDERSTSRSPRRDRAGPNRTRRTGGARRATRSAAPWPTPGSTAPASRPWASPDRCTVRRCSTTSDRVVRPALLWCDQRTGAECDAITAKVGAARLIELTLNPALTGFTLPKLLWVRRHEPALWARVRSVLLPKDYVRFRLTGERATDVADASGTLLFDVANRRWSAEVAGALDIDLALLPRAFESPEVTGTVSAAGAAATGLRAGTPVVAGGGDQAAGAVGMGIVEAGLVSATIGTSGVVFAATSKPALDPKGRRPHVLPRRARHVARHGRHPGRRAVAALAARHDGRRAHLRSARARRRPACRPAATARAGRRT